MSVLQNNRQLRCGVWMHIALSIAACAAGFATSTACGWVAAAVCVAAFGIYLGTELARYRALQKLSCDLDGLLTGGKPLPIRAYSEGELSILANQIQKMTLCLTESAETVKAEKTYLADSLADISHQLRTPLTAMNLTAAMLRAPNLSEDRRIELTGELRKLLDRTEWLVEALLKLSKLDAGTVTLAKERVRVRELIARAAAPIAVAMDLRSQTLRVNCADEQFTGDLIWSAEALGNILKNGMEHTPDGGTITVTAKETSLFTQIEVQDTGSGFDPKDIPHLFERFYKGANASESSYGIGLALARTVIAAQNGTVQASNCATGAKFTIRFYKQTI